MLMIRFYIVERERERGFTFLHVFILLRMGKTEFLSSEFGLRFACNENQSFSIEMLLQLQVNRHVCCFGKKISM